MCSASLAHAIRWAHATHEGPGFSLMRGCDEFWTNLALLDQGKVGIWGVLALALTAAGVGVGLGGGVCGWGAYAVPPFAFSA